GPGPAGIGRAQGYAGSTLRRGSPGDQAGSCIDRKPSRQSAGIKAGGAVGGGNLVAESTPHGTGGARGAVDHRSKRCAAELVGSPVPSAAGAPSNAIRIN